MKNKINKQNDSARIKNKYEIENRFKRYLATVKISASLMLIFGLLVLSGCSKNDSELENSPCESRTGNIMSAKVNGDQICTDLGSALLIKTNATQLTIVGLFSNANPAASITLNILNPETGTFEIADGQYGVDDGENIYIVGEEVGAGTVSITELSESRVKGTFEFTATGIDTSTDNPNGEQIEVSSGTFDFAILGE
ncbi:hypothetical protein SAMN05444280_10798 [Tangfeifania diversioriginum]|uniref:Uncharacterized protein n=2 Tax=Tangfeifania diversioriginum TaxID=1168035 RepID=A0A1M6ES59_9BACT|nr:hypothetical protein SAMN05444280_10798 [Tangfeifania diversioriginum]